MEIFFKPIECYQTRLYSISSSFNGFKDISADRFEHLKDIAARFQRNFLSSLKLSKIDKYKKTLEYTYSNQFMYPYNFDEKMLFIILVLDPNLLFLEAYLTSDIPSDLDINEEDKKVRDVLRMKRLEEFLLFQAKARELIGVYDDKLLFYEKSAAREIPLFGSLPKQVKMNYLPLFTERTKMINSFEEITDERFMELSEMAKTLLSFIGDVDYKTIIFYILYRTSLFNIKNIAEMAVLFILAFDADLNLLTIYEEESRLDYTKERSLKEKGVYSLEIIRLEKLYHLRFCPGKELSPWTFV